MPTIEVDESEFKNLAKIRETLAKINAAPEGKRLLQRAHKIVDPNAVTPDLDADAEKEKLSTEMQTKLAELQAKIEADKAERDKNESLASLNKKFEDGRTALRQRRYTPDGIKVVEKFMEEHGISDHVVVADHLEAQNPPQEIMSPRAFGGFNFVEQPKEEDAFLKKLLDSKGDDDNAVLHAAVEAVGELRGNARR